MKAEIFEYYSKISGEKMGSRKKQAKGFKAVLKKISSLKKEYIGAVIIVLLMVFVEKALSYYYYAYYLRKGKEEYSNEFVTNTNALYPKFYFTETMKKYGIKSNSDIEDMYENSYIIPGLNTTRTLIQGEHFSTCTSMTPQGVCVAGKYLLISAYCGSGKHNSVIYVINRNSHKFVKEIVLRGKPHVGGIAYDRWHRNVWFCDYSYKNQLAYVSAFTMDDLEQYDIKKNKHAIHYEYRVPIYSMQRTSFLDYDDGKLYVGHYENNLSGLTTIQTFTIDEKTGGLKSSEYTKWGTGIKEKATIPMNVQTIQSRVQGFTINDELSALSTSSGNRRSRLMVYEGSTDDSMRYLNDPVDTYSLPPMLEQISDYSGKLYLCFESAAYTYRARLNRKVDRIIVLDF